MKSNAIFGLSFIVLLVVTFCTGFKPTYSSIAGPIFFGTEQPNHGLCVGRGVCEDQVQGGTTVTFQISPNNPNVLMMTFLLSDLANNQPDQVPFFTDSSATYPFDSTYALNDSFFSQLNLQPNAMILPSSPSTVIINGDVVTDYITYSHG